MEPANNRRNKRIEVNGVSLIDLKAEISRRQTEVKAKATSVPNVSAPVLKGVGGNGIRSLLKRPVSPPHKKLKPIDSTEVDKSVEEQAVWDNVRRKLEAKARLYTALKEAASTGKIQFDYNEDDKAPLVDFERKVMEENIIDTDSSDEDKTSDKRKLSVPNTDPVSIPDGPVTYAHLRRGEVRDHGTGFYAFSEDIEQRAAEQAALRELRRRTEQARERAETERAKRIVAMGRRLAQLRARKGLPDVATAAANLLEEKKEPSSPPLSETHTISRTSPSPPPIFVGERLGSDDLDIASMLRRLRDEAEEKQATAATNAEVVVQSSRKESTLPLPLNMAQNRVTREWDRGKSFVLGSSSHPPRSRIAPPKRRFIGDQNKDEDRDPEFAPPKFY